ncbi:Bug family tripartite tricarboxylate transporter substrate binding protein [Aidingimonas lacisalsi]|uniref:Bug family tripartite tricarboxylate transporter substrate binding protein n=1 Tax=Aidingimonas lacisalsi TaxID=2604086 RepID=UPI00191C078D|nr:tripartite tricarboxylate transporter substrate binding protein [Aidingimonas lacisalsi]
MSTLKTLGIAVASASLLTAMAPLAVAQSDYPDKDIRWVIPWNAGGSNDIMARKLQPILEEEGFSTVIENVPGGTGAVGMGQVASANPDGYTIGNGTSSTLAIMAQGKVPLENDQFTHIIRLSVDPLLLVVPGTSEYDDLDSFIGYMEDNPGEVRIGTPGTNNLNHIFAAMTARSADTEYRHVPQSGGSQVIKDLLGEHIEAGVLKPSETMEQIEAGDLVPLGVFADERIDALPDVPTFEDEGYDVFPYGPVVQMGYIEAPADLDPEVRDKLTTAFESALTSEEFQTFAAENGFEVSPISGEELEQEVADVAQAIEEVSDKVFDD